MSSVKMSQGQQRLEEPNAKLSMVERLAYGLGDYNNNLVVPPGDVRTARCWLSC